MTLLERWDSGRELMDREQKEIRRALAIAEVAKNHASCGSLYAQAIIDEADELLKAPKRIPASPDIAAALDRLDAERKELLEAWCVWEEDYDANWTTGCGEMHTLLIDGRPHENSMRHCCYCGKRIKEKHYGTDV